MMQFYFLSIVCNVLAGLALLLNAEESGSMPLVEGLRETLKNETTRLVLGILSLIAGLFKILSVVRMDVVVVGDLLPALAGILASIALFNEYYTARSTIERTPNTAFVAIFVTRKKWIGWAALVAAALHFLFPNVLFL